MKVPLDHNCNDIMQYTLNSKQPWLHPNPAIQAKLYWVNCFRFSDNFGEYMVGNFAQILAFAHPSDRYRLFSLACKSIFRENVARYFVNLDYGGSNLSFFIIYV